MKTHQFFLKILIAVNLILFLSCSKKSTDPDDAIKSSVSVTGDLEESYDVFANFGISTYTSNTEEKDYFSLFLIPQNQGTNFLAMTLLYKSGPESPDKGTYKIGEYAFGQDIPLRISAVVLVVET